MTSETRIPPRTQLLDHCPVCESDNTQDFFTAPDRLHGVPGEFTYQKCADCNSVFQNPMVVPEDLHLCYPTDYAPYSYTQEIPDIDFDNLPMDSAKQKLRRTIVESVRGRGSTGAVASLGRLLSRLRSARERAFFGIVPDECLPNGRGSHNALDLGCGAGWFMLKLKQVGWTVDGLEWNEDAAQLARDRTGCQVWSGDFFNVELPAGKYDLIVLNHVFEHFADPKEVLCRLHRLLAGGGRVVMFYPNPNSLGARTYGSSWFPWEVPRHLVLPAVGAMKELSRRAGFRNSRTYARAYYSEVHWARSMAYLAGRHPELDPPELTTRETVRVAIERALAAAGYDAGWEIVSVLEK